MTAFAEIMADYERMSESERATVDALLEAHREDMIWCPNPGPQTHCYFSPAQEIYYGGAAGGGKTDLMLGTALNSHDVSQIFRLQHNDRVAIVRRLGEILSGKPGKPRGYNGAEHTWTGEVNGKHRIIEFGAMSDPNAWTHYMGRPASAKLWDELPQFTREGVTTVNQWLRSVDPNQRCRFIGAGNPPLAPEQFWVVEYWAPWLDPYHPNPAKPGELRWFVTDDDGNDIEVDADYVGYTPKGKIIKPISRTFIRADLDDNEELAQTGYGERLAAGPLGKILLDGVFDAAAKDHGMQLIPTEWVLLAQARWEARKDRDNGPVTAAAVDPNGGGKDEFGVICRRGVFIEEPALDTSVDYKRPAAGAAFVFANIEDDPRLLVDCTGGWGNAIVEHMAARDFEAHALEMAKASHRRTMANRALGGISYGFVNKRAEYMWGLREALDPDLNATLCLPPGRRVVAELTLPRWKPKTVAGQVCILIEPKEDIIKRYGKSPTILDLCAYVWAEPDADERQERRSARRGRMRGVSRGARSLTVQMGHANARERWSRS